MKTIQDYTYTKEELKKIVKYYEKEYYENLCRCKGLGMASGNVLTHQIIQAQIFANYLKRFDETILTETRLSDKLRITPDISIWDDVNYENGEARNPLLTIEITHTTRNDRYSEKTIYASFKNFPSICEAFIYNYETDKWTRYHRVKGKVVKEENQDYSQVLRCWLHTLLK